MDFTFLGILKRVLAKVPDHLDKREGSVIYDAVAPCCYELSYMFEEIKRILTVTFPDTSYDEFLTKRCAEFGVIRKEKTKAIRVLFAYDKEGAYVAVPLLGLFFADDLVYTVKERRLDGSYAVECNVPGSIGNKTIESVTSVKEVPGLVRCEIREVLVPGQEEETDENLLLRYKDKVKETPFGGNIADYKQKIESLAGVYKALIIPAFNGGGTVKAVIMDSDFNVPGDELLNKIEDAIDPIDSKGLGCGLSPIGHRVTVAGVSPFFVDISAKISLKEGYGLSVIEADIATKINEHLTELRRAFGDGNETIVRLSLLEALIVSCEGVLDVFDTKINNDTKNLVISPLEAAFLRNVTVYSGD